MFIYGEPPMDLTQWLRYFLLLMTLLMSFFILAEDSNSTDNPEAEIRIIALFENAAMIDIAGKQKLYRSGQSISPQIKLIKANTRLATLSINDEVIELGLTNSTSINLQSLDKQVQPENNTEKIARIVRNNSGMFKTSGFINGVAVPFLVDTGATTIAMNEAYAKLIGISYRINGERGLAQTASGMVSTWQVTLAKVRVGGIELTNVEAAVLKGNFPDDILLGMSFLNRIKVDYDGPLLTLTKKY